MTAAHSTLPFGTRYSVSHQMQRMRRKHAFPVKPTPANVSSPDIQARAIMPVIMVADASTIAIWNVFRGKVRPRRRMRRKDRQIAQLEPRFARNARGARPLAPRI